MHIYRLQLLEKHLRELDPRRFDMSLYSTAPNPNSNGESGCALGHATAIPELNLAGFELMSSKVYKFVPSFNGSTGFFAAAGFFQISIEDAYYLFSSACYDKDYQRSIPPQEVADRIRDFVRG